MMMTAATLLSEDVDGTWLLAVGAYIGYETR